MTMANWRNVKEMLDSRDKETFLYSVLMELNLDEESEFKIEDLEQISNMVDELADNFAGDLAMDAEEVEFVPDAAYIVLRWSIQDYLPGHMADLVKYVYKKVYKNWLKEIIADAFILLVQSKKI
jgi:hypothetical protein